MSDRYVRLTVALDGEYRAEDIEELMQAIRLLRGVGDVTMTAGDMTDWMASARLRSELRLKMHEAIRKAFDP